MQGQGYPMVASHDPAMIERRRGLAAGDQPGRRRLRVPDALRHPRRTSSGGWWRRATTSASTPPTATSGTATSCAGWPSGPPTWSFFLRSLVSPGAERQCCASAAGAWPQRGVSTTGTGGALRTILDACEPRKNRLMAELLVPMASTSPSTQRPSVSASDQESPWPTTVSTGWRARRSAAEGPARCRRPALAATPRPPAPRPRTRTAPLSTPSRAGPRSRPPAASRRCAVGHRGRGPQQVAVPSARPNATVTRADAGARPGAKPAGRQRHRHARCCAGAARRPRPALTRPSRRTPRSPSTTWVAPDLRGDLEQPGRRPSGPGGDQVVDRQVAIRARARACVQRLLRRPLLQGQELGVGAVRVGRPRGRDDGDDDDVARPERASIAPGPAPTCPAPPAPDRSGWSRAQTARRRMDWTTTWVTGRS